MSKKSLLLWVLLFSLKSFSQPVKNNFAEKEERFQKSQHQKTAAWLLLSGGTLMASAGYTLYIYEGLQGEGLKSGNATVAAVIFFSGVGAMISSIPLFTAAARNKKIAKSVVVNIKIEKSISPFPASFVKKSFPALTVKIRL